MPSGLRPTRARAGKARKFPAWFFRFRWAEVDRSSSKPGAIFKTDSEGRAVLDLPAGAHILSITYPAFKQWTRQIEVQGGVNLALDAKLDIADIGDAIVETAPVIPPPRSPEPIFLPLQPLFNFDPRPLQSTKRHR